MRVNPVAAALLSALTAGCYVYTPLDTATPIPKVEVALSLTDAGRVESGHTLGSAVDRVEEIGRASCRERV